MLETVSQDDPNQSNQAVQGRDNQTKIYSDYKISQRKQQANFNGELTFGGESQSKSTTNGAAKYGKTS